MRHIVFILSVLLVSVVSFYNVAKAKEGDACYSRSEAEAEQGIRIHSELMVIGLNCSHMADVNGNNLYLEHKKFTEEHKDLFEAYEKIMLSYLGKHGSKNPDKDLHGMRTKFANKISNDVARMRPDIFCKTYASRIEKASKMSDDTLRKWASTKFPEYPVSRQICGSKKN